VLTLGTNLVAVGDECLGPERLHLPISLASILEGRYRPVDSRYFDVVHFLSIHIHSHFRRFIPGHIY
jgi:hypothetical protein